MNPKPSPSQLILVLTLLVLLSSITLPTYGHALLLRSDPSQNISVPQSPARVSLWFSEPVEPLLSTLKVLDSSGSRIDSSDLVFASDHLSISVGIPSLSKGVYTVVWQVVSAADGHPTSGSFSFGVQTVVPPPSSGSVTVEPSLVSVLPEALVRWVLFLGQTILVGGLVFYNFVLAPWLRTGSEGETDKTRAAQYVTRVSLTSLLAALLALTGSIGLILVQSYSSSSGSFTITQYLFNSRLGTIGIARLGLTVALTIALFWVVRSRGARNLVLRLSLPLGLLLPLTASLVGHNAGIGPGASSSPTDSGWIGTLSTLINGFLPVTSDWAHGLAAAAWIGGLVSFALLIPLLRGDSLSKNLSGLVPFFSRVAIVSVGVVSITGLYSALLQIGSFSALFGTLYGLTLVLKVTLYLPLLLLGTSNQLLLHPRIVRAVKSAAQSLSWISRVSTRLTRSVGIEASIGLVLLLVVGLLTALPPAVQVSRVTIQQSSFAPTILSQTVDDVNLALSVFPFRVGANFFEANLKNNAGLPLQNVTQVIFDFKYLDAPLGTVTANANRTGETRYSVEGTFLSLAGNWRIDITTRRPTAFDAIAKFPVTLEAYPGLSTAYVTEMSITAQATTVFDAETDHSGAVWFTLPALGAIGRLVPQLRSFETFESPRQNSVPNLLAFDATGNVWFTDTLRHSIVSFDPKAKNSTEYLIPIPNARPSGMTIDGSGTVWITDKEESRVLSFSPTNKTFVANLATPTNASAPGPITVDQQQNLWFVEGNGTGTGTGTIVRLNPRTHNMTEYTPPSRAFFITTIQVAPNGDVWFAEHGSNRISRLHPADSSFKQVPLPNPTGYPWGLRIDSQGNVWFVEHIGNMMGFYDVSTGSFKEFPIPTSESGATNLALDQFGNAWFGEDTGKIGVLVLDPGPIGLVSQQDPLFTLGVIFALPGIAALTIVGFIQHRRRYASEFGVGETSS